jgi:hypothetical protein
MHVTSLRKCFVSNISVIILVENAAKLIISFQILLRNTIGVSTLILTSDINII